MSPLAVIAPTALGLATLAFIGIRLHILGKLALAYLLGMGILGQVMFSQSAYGNLWSLAGLNVSILVLTVSFLLFRVVVQILDAGADSSRKAGWIGVAIGLVLSGYSIWRYVYPYDYLDFLAALVLLVVVLEGRSARWQNFRQLGEVEAYRRAVYKVGQQIRLSVQELTLVDGIWFLVITANSLGLVVSTLNHSPFQSDSLWALTSRATIGALYKTIVFTDPNVFYSLDGIGINPHHWASPPFYELSRIWLFLNGVEFSHHVVSAFNMYALGLVLYGFLKDYLGPWAAGLSALLVLNTPYYRVWITEGYTESILFAYVGVYALFAIRFVLEQDLRAGVIALFFGGVVGLSRPEAMLIGPLGLLVFGGVLVLRRQFMAVPLIFVLLLKVYVPWWATVYQNKYDFLFFFYKPEIHLSLTEDVGGPTPAAAERKDNEIERIEAQYAGARESQQGLSLAQETKRRLITYRDLAIAQFAKVVRYLPYLREVIAHTIETKYSWRLFYLLASVFVLSLYWYKEVLGIVWMSLPVLGCYLMAKVYWLGSFEHLFAMWGSWETFFYSQEGHWWEGRYSSWTVVFLLCATFMMPFYRQVFGVIQRSWLPRTLLAMWVVFHAVL